MVSDKLFAPALFEKVTCQTEGVIYCLRCSKCNVLYVGETKRCARKRISEHLYNISNRKTSSALVTHFEECTGSVKFSILENVSKLCAKNDNELKKVLVEKENKWIRILNSAYPFGLNDSIKGYGLTRDIVDPCQHKNPPFLNYKICRQKRSHGRKKRSSKDVSPYSHWTELKSICNIHPATERYRRLYITLLSFNKKSLSNCLQNMQNSSTNGAVENELKLAILSIISGWNANGSKPNKTVIKRFHTPFNKFYEAIGVKSVVLDKKSVRKIPGRKFAEKFSIGFTYEQPISRKFCNYGSFLAKLNAGSLLKLLHEESCGCLDSKYLYPPAGHIITGDLSIVGEHLAPIMQEGAKFRICANSSKEKIVTDFNEVLDKIIEWDAHKKGVSEEVYQNYKRNCNWLLRKRMCQHLSCPYQTQKQEENAIKELAILHKKYIITVADKASNNFIVICKKYYAQVLCTELGIRCINGKLEILGNAVYKPMSQSVDDIISSHHRALEQFQGEIGHCNKRLPRLFATPKLHKNPYKFRFIAGARKSSIKEASFLLHRLLQFFKNHFMAYADVIKRRTQIETCWTVKGSRDVHSLYAKLHGQKITEIITADFSTMFTAFEHNILIKNVNSLIGLCFKNAGKHKVAVSRKKIWYTKQDCAYKGVITLDQYQCYQLVNSVVDNTCITFAGIAFRQIKGVPMGGNASPMLADLSLAMMEFDYLSKHKKEAKDLRYTRRYIDDILCFNHPGFLEIAANIYPPSLLLELTSAQNKATFLDSAVEINSENSRLLVRIYNKTDDFNFKVVRYISVASYISLNVGYNVFYGELIRFGRITNLKCEFIQKTAKLLKEFAKKGYTQEKLFEKINQYFKMFSSSLGKFGVYTLKDQWDIIAKIWNEF